MPAYDNASRRRRKATSNLYYYVGFLLILVAYSALFAVKGLLPFAGYTTTDGGFNKAARGEGEERYNDGFGVPEDGDGERRPAPPPRIGDDRPRKEEDIEHDGGGGEIGNGVVVVEIGDGDPGGVTRSGGVVGSDKEDTGETVKGPEPVSEPEPSKEAKELFTDRLERQRRRLIRCQGGEERWEALPPTTWRRSRPSF